MTDDPEPTNHTIISTATLSSNGEWSGWTHHKLFFKDYKSYDSLPDPVKCTDTHQEYETWWHWFWRNYANPQSPQFPKLP